jgi:hypothetical protein
MQIGLFRGEVGLMRAAEKAERIAADWMDSALGAVLVFSIGHVDKPFTMEAARVVVERLFPRPEGVDGRVWGHITRRAIKCGYIERVPGMFAQAASSNGSPKPCYRGRGWGAGA